MTEFAGRIWWLRRRLLATQYGKARGGHFAHTITTRRCLMVVNRYVVETTGWLAVLQILRGEGQRGVFRIDYLRNDLITRTLRAYAVGAEIQTSRERFVLGVDRR